MIIRKTNSSLAALAMGFLIALAGPAQAQWTTETYPVKAGYNAVWLSIDCSDRPIEELLPPSTNVQEVWQWNANASATQFTESPAAPDQPDAQWKVWRRDPTGHPASTLGLLSANAAYLVKVADGTAPFSLALTGKPVPPDYRWKSSGVNFVGFQTVPATPPTFTSFLSFSSTLKNAPPVFFYDGGELALNPRRLVTPNSKPVVRGHAYWVQTSDYTDYYGPLQVTVLRGGGLDYGRKLTSATVRVKNVTDPAKNQTIIATIALAGSEPGPGEGSAPQQVSLRLRGQRDANLQFTYTDLPAVVMLAPGEERDLVLDANRTMMSVPDQFYASILQVTDDLGHTRIDLPVSATGSSRSGVWIGAAVLDSVNQVETISGPEFDAPTGTPNGEGAETQSDIATTKTTAGGQTTRTTAFNAAFAADGTANLPGGGFANVSVTGSGGAPVYVAGTDYEVLASSPGRATVTNGGSGYIAPPDVSFTGGGGIGATAEATLSGGVRRVNMVMGGSGYIEAPKVLFTGGGGSGASGTAIVNEGLITDVTVINGGFAYSSAPSLSFSFGTGASADAVVGAGLVTGVNLTDGGSDYHDATEVAFTYGSGAEGDLVLGIGGVVTGVTITNGGSGYTAATTVGFQGDIGTGATGDPVIVNGVITGVNITAGGVSYDSSSSVAFNVPSGTGATADATILDGTITAITITNGGAGYSSPPTVVFVAPPGGGAVATPTIAGSVGAVIITHGGSGYTGPPTVVIAAADGDETGGGASATVYVSEPGENGVVTGVDVVRKLAGGSIGENARIAVATSGPAPAGTPDGSVTSTVTSISKLVTLNGKSHLNTRRVSTGEGAVAPSNFPVRLILHSPPSGPPTLLQQVYLGQRDGQAYAGPEEESLAALVKGPLTKLNGDGETVTVPPGNLGRASSASFPRGEFWSGAGALGDTASFVVTLEHNAETNPFLHTYHPDHDNWDARYESPLSDGNESYTITRDITFTFSPTPLPGVSDLSWGVTTLGGTYTESITGLRSGEGITVSGNFILHQVSEVPTLTTP